MADNTAKTLKIARLVALAHIVVGVLLFIFGIADRVHGYFWTGEGCFGIWCGVWMCITGALGIPASNRERNATSIAMSGAFMGLSITSSVFGGVIIICYSISISMYHFWWYNYYYDNHSEMAITAIILILGITEFGIGIWAAVLSCYLTNCNCCITAADQATSVVYVTGQGAVSGGYVMGQGPGGVPVAIPMQQTGGVVTVPGAYPQVVHMPASGMVQVAGQPQMYQVSTAGAVAGQPQMVHVPTSGAQMVMVPNPGNAGVQPQVGHTPLAAGTEGGQLQMVHGPVGAEGGQPQFVRVTPDGPMMEAPGGQYTQMPPQYNADEQIPVKT